MGAMRIGLAVAVLGALALVAGAQEYGRGSLGESAGLGQAPLPRPNYDIQFPSGTWGLKVDLGWAKVDWDIGPADGSETLFVPEVSVFYKMADSVDLNLSGLFASAEDEDGEWGRTSADMARLALGVRYWFDTGTRFTPYGGGGIGYYVVDGDVDNTREDGEVVPVADLSVKNTPGAFVEGGLAYQVADGFFVNVQLSYDFLLGSADATINGASEDFKVRVLAASLGATWMF